MIDDATPLSNMMKPLIEGAGAREIAAFHAAFLTADLGLIVHGLPPSQPGQRGHLIGPGDHVSATMVGTPDGRTMIKTCADPNVFARRFEPNINALMRGREILEMVLKMPGVEGVLVCSAASLHSIAIPRDDIPGLLELRRPWWKFW